jgi:hypothetical protein
MNNSMWANLAKMISGLAKMLIAVFAGAEDAVSMGRVAIASARRQQAIRVEFDESKFVTNIVAKTAVENARVEENLLEYAKSNPERAALVSKHKDELDKIAKRVLKEFEVTDKDE